MLVQLHWQNRDNLAQTDFVAQTDIDTGDAEKLNAWIQELIERRGQEMPKGYCPMVCTEDSKYFVMAIPAVLQG